MKFGLRHVFSASLLVIGFGGAASAQQPGSVQYNTQVLPANGIVARNALPDRWGAIAIAMDKSKRFGWKDDATSREDAEAGAIESCMATGGSKCEVIGSFANSCAALAFGADMYGVSYTGYTRRSLAYTKKDAVKLCGLEDCKIVRSGCTVPN